MSDEYKPISCDLHSQYELWIMRGEQIKLAWHTDDNITRIERVKPIDIRAEAGIEYLYFHDSRKKNRRIRLDYIIEAGVMS